MLHSCLIYKLQFQPHNEYDLIIPENFQLKIIPTKNFQKRESYRLSSTSPKTHEFYDTNTVASGQFLRPADQGGNFQKQGIREQGRYVLANDQSNIQVQVKGQGD